METIKVTTSSGEKKNVETALVDDFKANLGGSLLTSDDMEFDEVRKLWNGMHDKRPAIIVRCAGVADVIAAVNFGRENNILLSVRGGGHNVAGSASNDGGIMIDLSLMRAVRVDVNTQTAHAQGGATLGDLDRETQAFGMVAPAGVVSTTGIAGLTLGGGLGWLRKKYGLSIDNLVSVDIVTADGNFENASASSNSDLFWAVRGGGGNFGIVTSFEYQLHPVGPMVYFCGVFYPAEEAKDILPVWKEFVDSSSDEVSSTAMFWTIPSVPDFPAEIHGRRFLALTAVHCGPPEEGEKVLEPLRKISTPLIDISTPIPWKILQSMFDSFFPKVEQLYYFKSTYLNNLDTDTIDAIIPKAIKPPQPMILIAIWHLGGAMSRIDDSETAFTGRKSNYLFSIDAVWSDPDATDKVISYAREFLKDMETFSPGGLYVNFAGLGEEGEELVKSAYGDNYQKLKEIKRKYDPDNIFHLNQNIKP